jgi:hypothetical protein
MVAVEPTALWLCGGRRGREERRMFPAIYHGTKDSSLFSSSSQPGPGLEGFSTLGIVVNTTSLTLRVLDNDVIKASSNIFLRHTDNTPLDIVIF